MKYNNIHFSLVFTLLFTSDSQSMQTEEDKPPSYQEYLQEIDKPPTRDNSLPITIEPSETPVSTTTEQQLSVNTKKQECKDVCAIGCMPVTCPLCFCYGYVTTAALCIACGGIKTSFYCEAEGDDICASCVIGQIASCCAWPFVGIIGGIKQVQNCYDACISKTTDLESTCGKTIDTIFGE